MHGPVDKDRRPVYNSIPNPWVIPEGEYGILIGQSVEEIMLSENVYVEGVKDPVIPKPVLTIQEEEGEKFSITSSYAELAEYSDIAKKVLDDAKVSIPFNQLDVHLDK